MPQRPFNAAVRVNASFWLLVLLAAIVSPLTVVAAILTAAALLVPRLKRVIKL